MPTLLEIGLDGYPPETWMGIVAPAGTSQHVISKLNATANAAMHSAQVKAALKKLGFEASTGTPAAGWQPAASTGGGLKFDGDGFHFNWKTTGLGAGCWSVGVKTADTLRHATGVLIR